MGRTAIALMIALLGAGALEAQSGSSLAELRKANWGYDAVKSNLIRAAEKVPEADYAYRPSPDVRTIADLFGHIADVQARLCGMASGEMKDLHASAMKTKAELVPALKASFDACDAAFEKVTPANANEMVGSGRGAQTRMGELEHVVIHDNEEYGYLAVYLRLKNIVPPSSDRSGR